VQILDHQHERANARGLDGERAHCLEHLLAPGRRIHRGHRGVAGIDRQQVADERNVRVDRTQVAHTLLDLGDDVRLGVELLDAEVSAQLVEDRQEGDGLAERDALPLEPCDAVAGIDDAPPQLQQQPGLADARLSGQEHDLPAALPHLGEAVEEGGQLTLAPYE
jgi:hypothetical protein